MCCHEGVLHIEDAGVHVERTGEQPDPGPGCQRLEMVAMATTFLASSLLNLLLTLSACTSGFDKLSLAEVCLQLGVFHFI